MKKITYTALTVALIFIAGIVTSFTVNKNSYEETIRAWQLERTAQLKKAESPLNLAGLFWLNEGLNTFGSGADNDIIFPSTSFPKNAGAFVRKGDTVSIHVKEDVKIYSDGKLVTDGVIFDKVAKKLEHGRLRWLVLRSGDRLAVRLYDLDNENQKKFKDVDRYKISPEWRVKAQYTAHVNPKKIDITNIIGQTYPRLVSGTLQFTLKGKTYNFEALEGDELFIVFGDPTNGKGSYPSGRFLYAPKPAKDGEVILDFNKAINPNCAFTPYALCPLPPKTNHFSVAITAGEKKYEAK
jgi:uncharacterized protein (DUF1684 family)